MLCWLLCVPAPSRPIMAMQDSPMITVASAASISEKPGRDVRLHRVTDDDVRFAGQPGKRHSDAAVMAGAFLPVAGRLQRI
jgi:hypothetical protein